MPAVTIRPARSIADYLALQAAQRAAWGVTQEEYVVPVATLVGANLHGGLVLGAFLDDGRAAGVSFAFRGQVAGKACLYSQLTGVVPDFQDLGIGTRMKLAQRDFALRCDLAAIAWAFDPFRVGNARFNLAKLGAKAIHYYVDMYGPRTDALNQGAPTDRLLAWWPVSPQPRRSVEAAPSARNCLVATSAGKPVLNPTALEAPPAWIPIPADIIRLRQTSAVQAQAWVEAVRVAFQAAFAAGWCATDFVDVAQGAETRQFYLVEPDAAV